MKSEAKFFERKKAVPERLKEYGFAQTGADYVYKTPILNGDFILKVLISRNDILTNIRDTKNEYDYILHNVLGAEGKFVGEVRSEYEKVLKEIRDRCFVPDVFKSTEFEVITKYVAKKYGDNPEFLWDKPPDAAVLRHKNSKKWYAVFMKVNADKLGLQAPNEVEIVDLKLKPEYLDNLIDNVKIFPGYHMNKKHWITILLNNSVPIAEIFKFIDISYFLTTSRQGKNE